MKEYKVLTICEVLNISLLSLEVAIRLNVAPYLMVFWEYTNIFQRVTQNCRSNGTKKLCPILKCVIYRK